MRKLYLSRTDSKLTGLCGGIAQWLGIDATIVRLITVIAALFSFGSILLVYLLSSWVVPKEPGFGGGGYGYHGPHNHY